MFMHMSRHMSTHTLRIMSMHRSMYMPVHMSIQIDACTDIYADVHAGVHTHTWTHAFTRLRMPVHMSIPVFTATQPTTAPSAREVATSMQRSEPTQCRLMSPRSPVRRSIPTRREHIPHRAQIARWTHLEHVLDGFADLLDVPVQMLIGYDTPMAIAPTETVEHKPGAPHVFRTALGWTAIGCSQATQRPRHVTTHRISVIEELAPGEAGFAMRTTFQEKPALPRPDAVLHALEPETGERDSEMRR